MHMGGDVLTKTVYSAGCLPADMHKQGDMYINSSAPGQNGRHFADDTFKCILMNEEFCCCCFSI